MLFEAFVFSWIIPSPQETPKMFRKKIALFLKIKGPFHQFLVNAILYNRTKFVIGYCDSENLFVAWSKSRACMTHINADKWNLCATTSRRVVVFDWYKQLVQRGEGGLGPDHNFWSKIDHFLFLLLFGPEACNTCKNTIKLFLRDWWKSFFSKWSIFFM